jgi:hypothetical protein
MAYPALPSFPTSTTTSYADLCHVTAGDRFVLRGYEYRATCSAQLTGNLLCINAQCVNPAMPSGWELVTIVEQRPSVEGGAA